MEEWQSLLRGSVTTYEGLARYLPVDRGEVEPVISTYPMRINPYYLGLISRGGLPLWRQAVPSLQEILDHSGEEDPLEEERDSPVPNLTHRYPDRVLFLVSGECAMYCRFCTRKRKVGRSLKVTAATLKAGLRYIREHPEIRDVLLSGGDPFLLSDGRLEAILGELRSIPHVKILRIGSRVPCTLPQRVTPELVRMLRMFHPLFVNVHFNHPAELTAEAKEALGRLADAGIPLGNQSVLLRGVNDDPEVLHALFTGLLEARVKPYYLYLADAVTGTSHFRTSLEEGLKAMGRLRGYTSGMAVPTFVVDTPGGGGKVPLADSAILARDARSFLVRNYRGGVFACPEPAPPLAAPTAAK